jgi:hypothetical protein
MDPQFCLLSDTADASLYSSTNSVAVDPGVIDSYVNQFEATSKGAAFGNFVNITFTPNGLLGDYHISHLSPAVDQGGGVFLIPQLRVLNRDFDRQPRPQGAGVDIGADEVQ